MLNIDGEQHRLSRATARELQSVVGDALVARREFLHTSGEHRADGSYVVARRGADSAGNEKVFESFDEVNRLFERLPATFTAADIGRTGITGSRRHMLARYFAEHPEFHCELTGRNPLTVEKGDLGADSGSTEVTSATAD